MSSVPTVVRRLLHPSPPSAVLRAARIPALLAVVSAAAGCEGGGEGSVAVEVEAAVSELVTTTVTVEVACEPEAAVTATLDGVEVWRSEVPDRAHHVVLGGLVPDADYDLQVSAAAADGATGAARRAISTGPVPAELPALSLVEDGDPAPEGFIATAFLGEPATAAVVDPQGRYRWWWIDDRTDRATTRVTPARDGRGMLVNAFGVFGGGSGAGTEGEVVRVALDGEVVERIAIPDGHHDFVERDDGVIAVITSDPAQIEGHEVIGDAVVEVAPDGTRRTVWSVWDDLEYDGDLPPDPPEWSHANALDLLSDEDAYLVSLRDLDTVVLVDRSTGEARWIVGGTQGRIAIDGEPFREQHQVLLRGDELIVFDNGTVERTDTRVVSFTVDAAAGIAEENWSLHRDPPAYAFALGDVIPGPGESLLIGWGTLGSLDLREPDAPAPTWRLEVELGAAMGYLSPVAGLVWGCSGEGCADGGG